MKVLVLGGGVIGVTSAWYLAARGCEVVVIDRAAGVACETSHANGGQISVCQSAPWAAPGTPAQVLRWLLRADAPLLLRPRLDTAQWAWALRFVAECRPARHRRNLRAILALGLYSRASLAALREELGLDYRQQRRGIVGLYATPAQFRAARAHCQLLNGLGVRQQMLDAAGLAALEPALAGVAPGLAGASWSPDDESGDARLFTRELAAHAAARGVEFRFSTRVNALDVEGGRVVGASVTGPDGDYQRLTADACVLALGSFSPQLARPLGLRLPVYPLKGYSLTLPVLRPELAPTASITDEANKIVISRLGDELRVAGTAELSGYSHHLEPRRCEPLLRRARALFPDACGWDSGRYWSGLRPATPGNVPLIGRSACANLYLNTGHGTLGWTGAAGSARALADIVCGRWPEPDFPFAGL